ncbi:glycoside hydrolase family 13 protein [Butyrivibrio sp. AE2032]|uniref:glycoside hydrolase family 13 protein n=1 Tax=Butyrivibrio sp. AE2032 TaxID=1458463 RepID=UPI00068F36F0|nr:glycoside hydrolase family 13 protein [Butyrivibrio sp. AE2032]
MPSSDKKERNNKARCIHASRLPEYRQPFGARPCTSNVDIFFDCFKEASNVTFCYTYGLYNFTYHEEPMYSVSGLGRYHVNLMLPSEPSILFYWFRFNVPGDLKDLPDYFRVASDNDIPAPVITLYYGAGMDTKDGEGTLYNEPPRVGVDEDKYPFAFQITVYNKEFKTPAFLKGAMIYQIFPDRFARDTSFDYEKMIRLDDRQERIYHKDWNEDVDTKGKPETGYLACDFYGGSLKGIEEKLDYLKELGITVLYLNPIFEARSSHRYDTADYLNVDPILGGTSAFMSLQSACKERGIKIILDGVFSHTGADSKYFNKFDRYEGTGAYRAFRDGEESRYRSWYNFYRNEDGSVGYRSWWGFPDLPDINEDDLSYRNFIFGKDGVVDTWTSRGASGFRLDVSDELPDSFIRQMRSTVKEKTGGEGAVIGEVWEDASNKCSYGSYRDFMLGNTHDSVMGYTFRHIVLDYLCGYIDADIADTRLEGFRERYPKEAYYSMMNLVSSHDVPRIMTALSRPCDTDDREVQRGFKVEAQHYDVVSSLSKMAFALQTCYIGASCIYYGDEILMEGYKDPFNRRTYPWNRIDQRQAEALTYFRRIARIRTENDCLRTGFYKTLMAEGGTFAFVRYLKEGRDAFGREASGSRAIVLVANRSDKPVYVDVSERYGDFGCKASADDGAIHPLSEQFILGGILGGTRKIGIKPFGTAFLIY